MTILGSLFGGFFGGGSGRDYPEGNPARVGDTTVGMYDAFSGRTSAGVTVTNDVATSISAVYRAVQLIASTIASLPLHVFEEQDDGSKLKVEYQVDHYLWSRPNPEVSSVVFWETAIGHEVLNGNAYIWVETRNGANPIVALWLISPERVRVGRDEGGKKIYVIDGNVPQRDYIDGGNMVHVTGWGRNGLVGISPIQQMATTLGMAKAAEEFASRMFANGTTLSGVLSSDAEIDMATAREMSRRWNEAHAGLQNVGKAAVIGNGLKWTPTSISPEDAQMLVTRQFQVAEIARMFGVPEFLIGSHDKTSSWGAGLEINNRAFIQYSLAPHMLRFEQAITDELLRGNETGRYVKFETGGLLRGTTQERYQTYQLGSQMGVFSINDMLALEDRPGIGPDGDLRYIPLNMGVVGQPAPGDTAPPA